MYRELYELPPALLYLSRVRISASVQNLFDRDPPYLLFDGYKVGFNYDSTNTSPLGRTASLQLVGQW